VVTTPTNHVAPPNGAWVFDYYLFRQNDLRALVFCLRDFLTLYIFSPCCIATVEFGSSQSSTGARRISTSFAMQRSCSVQLPWAPAPNPARAAEVFSRSPPTNGIPVQPVVVRNSAAGPDEVSGGSESRTSMLYRTILSPSIFYRPDAGTANDGTYDVLLSCRALTHILIH